MLVHGKARKSLAAAPRKDKEHIAQALKDMRSNPFGGDLRHVRGKAGWLGRRVGDWRIQFSFDKSEGVVVVWEIGRKKDDTYK